jgi:lysozyme
VEISEQGRAFIRRRESVRLQPHYDEIGQVWDIGYGHVFKDDEPRRSITQAEAEALFDIDAHYYADHVTQLVTAAISQWMFDALASFVYNCGHAALANSTLLGYVNEGRHAEACVEFLTWNKSNGKFIEGLLKRRAMEVLIYARGLYDY